MHSFLVPNYVSVVVFFTVICRKADKNAQLFYDQITFSEIFSYLLEKNSNFSQFLTLALFPQLIRERILIKMHSFLVPN
jgi:hypothetical protein